MRDAPWQHRVDSLGARLRCWAVPVVKARKWYLPPPPAGDDLAGRANQDLHELVGARPKASGATGK